MGEIWIEQSSEMNFYDGKILESTGSFHTGVSSWKHCLAICPTWFGL